MSIAWVFPGQGSQKLGMADSLLGLPGAIQRFAFASEILERDLLEICRGTSPKKGELYDLNDTRNTQLAMFVVESLLVDDLRRQGRLPSLVAGHSLGEFVALYAAEVFTAEKALTLLKRRSELMAAAGGGAMTAVIGFDRDQLEGLVGASEGVFIANDNSDAQVVLSGSPEAVQEMTGQLACKRAIPLQVSGAFHSPFMADAAKAFAEELERVVFNAARIPVISNSEPTLSSDAQLLKQRLKQQMVTGVRWRETMNLMLNTGVSNLVEIGPGNVLSGLAKRSLKGVNANQIASASDLGH